MADKVQGVQVSDTTKMRRDSAVGSIKEIMLKQFAIINC
jgi:hypothetical protein